MHSDLLVGTLRLPCRYLKYLPQLFTAGIAPPRHRLDGLTQLPQPAEAVASTPGPRRRTSRRRPQPGAAAAPLR